MPGINGLLLTSPLSVSDSIFTFHCVSDTIYPLLYLDNIVLTVSNTSGITQVISHLSTEFAMTNLGPLSFFSTLGLLIPLKICFVHKMCLLRIFFLILK
uniref:Reverse transcriptase domain-containing protein n=1 Tax=Lactuca sativa TaxID=4236 RepID=A0A9R1UX43_LACSA|nr:hypothetical protein LSAT_V11C800392420 [Lactuca sativa]